MRAKLIAFIFTFSAILTYAQNSSVKVSPIVKYETTSEGTITNFLFGLESKETYSEAVYPSFNVKFNRYADIAVIENQVFTNVNIEIEVTPIRDKEYKGVNIIVKDSIGKKRLYKSSFPISFLYGFGNKSLQLGIDNVLLQMVLFKTNDEKWILYIKESGIY